jgi:1,4-alpha-glucan branching enzyme
MARKNASKRKQVFTFKAPTASKVLLAGDFTDWQQRPVSLKKEADGIWRTIVTLEPGAHHYRFLVDGQWQDDPECALHVPNPYGGEDAVRAVN